MNEFLNRTGVKNATLVPGGQSGPAGGWRQKLDLWRGAPHGLRLDVDPAFARALKDALTTIRPQAVLVEHIYLVQYRRLLGDVPVFVSCHNVETTKMRRWFDGQTAGVPARLRQRLQIETMRRFESNLGRVTRAVFATSDFDREELQRMNGVGRFLCVPNGADLNTFALRPAESFQGPPAAFFVGSLFYKPNLDATLLLKSEIWPRVRREIPDAVCHIAGNPGGLDLNSLNAPDAGVLFHGLVPDIRPWLARSQVMVVPLQVGSGTRIKIIESMATGTPVVSTTIGAEGIHYTPGENILLADTVEAMAKSTVRLLQDRPAALRIGRAGRALVESQYNWDHSAKIMEEIIAGGIS